ncbi:MULTISPECIES: cytochrome c oxidase subunit 3 [Pseudanabaena]|uniref:Oxidase aa(3) subunit 3 n=2 Tax=Pseudanabaena TaxID=1152 RepID=L8MUV3_9CYAN|nr:MULTISPECIES: heme-copper oxidase subunit III [Pseudanabaena]ELS30599.1 Cytochrome-c oxidase [Pseudanabaena biceps PCC 7429]MDG3497131.1 heme-copper oxidase subunit III [Pseudanabaena catenata USMAC16]
MQPVNTSVSENPILEAAHEAAHHEHTDNRMFGFVVFLLSESVIFLSFFAGYIVYKTTSLHWLPDGVTGLEIKEPTINTIILVSSSFTIYIAEKFLHKNNLWGFRAFWLLTIAMGSYFLYGQAVEWSGLAFGFDDGVFGGSFYLLTGFHGLHVLTGVLLQLIMLVRSFLPNEYDKGLYGIEATSLFWHFVDVIWIALFTLIYVWQ